MKKTCPRCHKRVGVRATRCRGCGYLFPEGRGSPPAGIAIGAGLPLLMGGLVLFLYGTNLPVGFAILAIAMMVGSLGLFLSLR
jgi:hypothetical protein